MCSSDLFPSHDTTVTASSASTALPSSGITYCFLLYRPALHLLHGHIFPTGQYPSLLFTVFAQLSTSTLSRISRLFSSANLLNVLDDIISDPLSLVFFREFSVSFHLIFTHFFPSFQFPTHLFYYGCSCHLFI